MGMWIENTNKIKKNKRTNASSLKISATQLLHRMIFLVLLSELWD